MSEIIKDGDVAVVKPGRDIVASIVEEFKGELKQLVDDNQQIAIDLTGVEMLDSMGIGILIAAHNSLQKKGNKLELRHASADILKLLQNMRLNNHFIISE